ncbi:MAG: hypothetical protein L3J35_03880 [Bacteroidales bacterium]|nr:hypothetical protein [Bacteroidales bacterium]
MKFNKYINYIFLLISFLFLSSCYEYPELTDIQYEDYRRVIGPEGGIINFYQNYENDSIKNVLVKMDFPKNALDSFVVFNMYEFYDEAVFVDLDYMGRLQQTKFLYFVPFYESYGYIQHTETDSLIDRHLSIDFNSPVTISYNLNFYQVDNDAKLYRIKIPRVTDTLNQNGDNYNEWGQLDNVWVNWNLQGYPDGYDNLDLTYLINGRWTSNYIWGSGPLSLDNWEEFAPDAFQYDSVGKIVSFDIYNTDYMYVMAKDYQF